MDIWESRKKGVCTGSQDQKDLGSGTWRRTGHRTGYGLKFRQFPIYPGKDFPVLTCIAIPIIPMPL
jgi:hypothetical protein